MPRSAIVAVCAVTSCAAAPALAISPIPDPADDATGPAGSPDLISISGAFDATTLHLSASFAPGSFNPAADGVLFGLDIDVNPATGVGAPAFFPIGGEFSVLYNSSFSTTLARVFDLSSGLSIALVPVVLGANSAQVSVPLLTLANDDGVMGFGATAGNPVSPDFFGVTDFAPNSADNGPLTSLTKFIPAPGGAATLALLCAARASRRRR